MKSNRRKFSKYSTLTGIGLAGIDKVKIYGAPTLTETIIRSSDAPGKPYFNMSGYAAPKLDVVRIGFIGLGNRGPAAVDRMRHIESVEIKALCDLRPAKADAVKKSLEATIHTPEVYTGGEDEWKKLCERADIDLVYI